MVWPLNRDTEGHGLRARAGLIEVRRVQNDRGGLPVDGCGQLGCMDISYPDRRRMAGKKTDTRFSLDLEKTKNDTDRRW